MGAVAVFVQESNKVSFLNTVYHGNPEPKNFREAQNSLDFLNWCEAICTEFRKMEQKHVWKITQNTNVQGKIISRPQAY
jgi:hypothetical protein